MTGSAVLRVPSCASALLSAPGVVASATTGGWQDKTAHIAWRSIGCFCWAFLVFPHIAVMGRNVRPPFNSLDFLQLSHISRPRHGR